LRIQKIPEKNPELTNESKDKKKKKTIYFTGEKNLLSFVTPLSLKEHFSRGLVIATYEIKTNEKGLYDLYYSETIVNPKILATLSDETERRLGLDNIKEFTVFLRDYDRISIVYLDDKEEVDDETAAAATEDNESIPRKMTSNTDTILDPDVIEGTHLKWKEKIHAKIPLSIKLLVSKNGKEQELMSPIMAMYSYFAYGQ
jgi:ferric iron reductase protein FhuF